MTPTAADPIESKIQNAIFHNPHLSSGRIHFQTNAGRVRVTGRVPTWFEKQMVQEAIKRIDGVDRIDNELAVGWPEQ
jgi:osmotically-inducible protein OsmY